MLSYMYKNDHGSAECKSAFSFNKVIAIVA